jgi:preprotein translocase subunit SecA
MNKQRELIYGQRRRVLMGEDMHDSFTEMIENSVKSVTDTYCSSHAKASDWNLMGAEKEICELTNTSLNLFINRNIKRAEEVLEQCNDYVIRLRDKREAEFKESGVDMREVERVMLLRSVDEHWMDHIDAMDQLRQGIGLRAYAQSDPINAYTAEGFEMFDTMTEEIREQAVRNLFRVSVRRAPVERKQVAKVIEAAAEGGNKPAMKKRGEKIGRNDPCPCGSGKKYKHCHGKDA